MRLNPIIIFLIFSLQSNANDTLKLNSIEKTQINQGITADTAEFIISITDSLGSNSYLFIPKNFNYIQATNITSGQTLVRGKQLSSDNKINDPYFMFPVSRSDIIRIKILSNQNLIFPIETKSSAEIQKLISQRNIFSAIFIGIMFSMIVYNLVLYFFLKDFNYLIYVLYLITIALAQLSLTQFDFYFFENLQRLYPITLNLFSGLSGIFALIFVQSFLKTRTKFKKIHNVLTFLILIYASVILALILGLEHLSYRLVQMGGISVPVVIFFSIYIARRGDKSGVYLAFGWSILILGAAFLTLKDFNIVPSNFITNNMMPIGVAVESIILSVALANRINLLNEEKETANQRVFEEISKNEELIRNQNVILEEKVKLRTTELEMALDELKSAQTQLVQSEKMASLGVLTAGIAHEINNPINFVTANVIPLRENIHNLTSLIDEYKSIDYTNLENELERISELEEKLELAYIRDETKSLIDGIEEGAKRTHSIVDGLKTFSHGDADMTSVANINTGIESTLSVLKSKLKNVKVEKNLDPTIPKIECQIGKLNQVFLNLINNALDALDEKYGEDVSLAKLQVRSYCKDDKIYIEVEDNANGMSEDVQSKIFEPFFTTKTVGKGTGLGMSISYSIIEDHNGEFLFESEVGKGTKFILVLPIS